jgi:hypothetical protein
LPLAADEEWAQYGFLMARMLLFQEQSAPSLLARALQARLLRSPLFSPD